MIENASTIVSIGSFGEKLPTNRETLSSGDLVDPDDELINTPSDVVAVLGFDPASEK